ncbi:MAG: EF-hand domain-containing protein [Deltaproteobacteria bacterium]|nr:EF-hand domain-containing protein [Deltaproteobacteria bacterium]
MAKELSEDKLAELREIFGHFDLDGNGSMEARELAKLLTTLGGDEAADHLDAALIALDANGNGVIEFTEFVDWWADR